jgi:hypothetical protein
MSKPFFSSQTQTEKEGPIFSDHPRRPPAFRPSPRPQRNLLSIDNVSYHEGGRDREVFILSVLFVVLVDGSFSTSTTEPR